VLPILRTDQSAIARHPAKIKVLACGRRWGKTVLGGRIVMEVLRQHGKVAWIAPTYKNSRPLWRWAVNAAAPAAKAGRMRVNQGDRTIETTGGGMLAVYSGDNIDSIRGEAFHLAVLDEAAMLGPEAWSDAIMPTLADYDGDALLISTPKGQNWFWQEYVRAQGDGRESAAWTAPSNANPIPAIQRAYEKARNLVSARTFQQEWDAQFITDGSVFRNPRALATATPQSERVAGHSYIIGVDWGRTDDATVFAVIDATTRELVALDRMTAVDYALQTGRLRALAERFDAAQIVAEQNSMGGPLVEQLLAEGLPVLGFVTTNQSKARIIDGLALAFERAELALLPDPRLLAELEAYASEQLPGGAIRYSAPAGMHDDCVMALALAHSQAAWATLDFMRVLV
ncbi:MAG: hypothetical protein KKI08_06145, partial [Armatimonadetes bacterium]|nr:hypothetical protein [Armatimonadota bacterium]